VAQAAVVAPRAATGAISDAGNIFDPVPVVIGEAQRGLVPAQLERDPAGAPPVARFSAAPSFNPIDAHGMEKTYLPYLDRADPRGPCC
jgi:hypothetical protein